MKRTDDKTLIAALRILANDIQSQDGVANAAIWEAAQRLEELTSCSPYDPYWVVFDETGTNRFLTLDAALDYYTRALDWASDPSNGYDNLLELRRVQVLRRHVPFTE